MLIALASKKRLYLEQLERDYNSTTRITNTRICNLKLNINPIPNGIAQSGPV